MKETYNYLEAVKNDVRDYITNNAADLKDEYTDRDELEEYLSDELWCEDSVTGNGSGSYTFSTWQAEENLCHNFDLLQEMAEDFGQDIGELVKKGAEACDVSIRCYLLDRAISEMLDELIEG